MNIQKLELYQFPISHFCEKVRWALDYKELDYQKINWLPGLHLRSAKKMAASSSVPILKHGSEVIQGSAQIIDYLENNFAGASLNFNDPQLNKEAKEWERFADEQIGPHTRRIIYHNLLNYPELVIPMFAHQGPWYSKAYFKISYPKLTQIMRKAMQINDQHVAESKQILQASLGKLNDSLNAKKSATNNAVYLVGDRFSRADLSVCALLAPLYPSARYGLNWPEKWPAELQAQLDYYQPLVEHARRCYLAHR